MSVLQEFEEIHKQIGNGKFEAIGVYLKEICPQEKLDKVFEECKAICYNTDSCFDILEKIKKENKVIFLDDVLYKKNEWKKFNKWFQNYIKPFQMTGDFDKICVSLKQENFQYNWLKELKDNSNSYGDGYRYEDLFKDYLETNFSNLNLDYDSYDDVFCVFCENQHDADQVIFELSKLYKDEDKMLELIKDTKQKYDYNFETHKFV